MKLIRMFFMAASLLLISASAPASAQAPLIVSGMDAVVGNSGWYTSNVIIHTATFADPEILAPAADIRVDSEGLHEVPIPDGLGGTATQFVNIDKTAPVVSINDLYVREDGATILSVSVSDPISGPGELDVSLDNGLTWQIYIAHQDPSIPEYVWNLEIESDKVAGKHAGILARAVDVAGNMSAVLTFDEAEK